MDRGHLEFGKSRVPPRHLKFESTKGWLVQGPMQGPETVSISSTGGEPNPVELGHSKGEGSGVSICTPDRRPPVLFHHKVDVEPQKRTLGRSKSLVVNTPPNLHLKGRPTIILTDFSSSVLSSKSGTGGFSL